MPLHLHRFVGKCAAGDMFSYGWYANGIRDLDTAHNAAVLWNAALWNGATAGNGYKDHTTADVSMLRVITAEITPSTGYQTVRKDSDQVIAGVAAGNACPADVALVISLRTTLARRAGRGRFYLPQPAASQLTSTGRVLPDLIGDLIGALSAAWAAYNTATDRPVLYSRTAHTIRNLVSFDIGDLFDTQRRRENKLTEVRSSASMP
jgi:hypothetical protein